MSKLGNRTKNLLGKWKSHSQSVDIVIGSNPAILQQQGDLHTKLYPDVL